MNLLEIDKEIALRDNYQQLYQQHEKDTKEGRLPTQKSGDEIVKCEAELLLNIYSFSYHIKELCRMALRDDSVHLEQSKRSELEEMIKDLDSETENIEKHIIARLSKAYGDSF